VTPSLQVSKPMLDRRPSLRLALSIVAVVAMLAPSSSVAIDAPPVPVSDNRLDRPIVDVALVARADGQPTPDLLTLSTVGQGPGGVAVALLRREDTWSPIIEETIGVGSATGGSKPWLVELGARRFAVLAVDPDTGRTFVTAVSVAGDPDIGHPLAQATTTIDLVVTDAGAADTDGDGIAELVVTGVVGQPDSPPRCVQTIVEVIDGSSLAPRAAYPMTDRRLAGAAIGEWDGRPGADLLAYVAEGDPCTIGSTADPEELSGLLAIRLRDGSAIVERPLHSFVDPPGLPLALDLDDDGRDEALVRDGPSLVLLDPSRRWSAIAVAADGAAPMLAAPSEGPDAHGGRIAWFGPEGTRSGMVVSMTGVFRARTGEIVVTTPSSRELPGLPSTRGELGRLVMQDAATLQQAPQVWRGDLDGDGCPEVLAPLVTAECDGQLSLRAGALWLATRPLTTFDVGANRELLVAPAMDWDPVLGRPLAPTPSAAGAPGAWRHGPSVGFVLSELRAGDATYFATYPIPRPTIDRIAVREHATDVPGFTGARVLVRSETTKLKDRRPPVAPTLEAFLGRSVDPGELVSLARIPVPSGAEAGRDGSFVRVPLPDILTSADVPVEGWAVSMSQLNDWGEIAPPVAGTVARDTTGPSLALETPFTSAPWPWEASLHGRSERGVMVSIGDGPPVETDRLGRFVIPAQLAPWPQTVAVTAVDPSGNATTATVSVIGGVDYREFPWPAILATVLILGALIGAVRSGRGGAVRELVPASLDDEPFPEIEDLPSGTRF
jgi:hypothetical protein